MGVKGAVCVLALTGGFSRQFAIFFHLAPPWCSRARAEHKQNMSKLLNARIVAHELAASWAHSCLSFYHLVPSYGSLGGLHL